jgi:opacity protein-like surface antigen
LGGFGKYRSTRDDPLHPALELCAPGASQAQDFEKTVTGIVVTGLVVDRSTVVVYKIYNWSQQQTFQGEDKMKSRDPVFMVFLLLTVLAVPAFAAGPYVGAEAGGVFLSDSTISNSTGSGDIKYDTGFGLGLFGGYDYGTWRLEGEFAYRLNDHDEFSVTGFTAPLDGDTSSMALMVNAYYDFKMVSPTIVPYIGVGTGGAFISVDASVEGLQLLDDDDLVFAYQAMAGVGFAVNKQVTIDLGYKYFATADPSIEVEGGGSVDSEYASHNVFLGLRYNF